MKTNNWKHSIFAMTRSLISLMGWPTLLIVNLEVIIQRVGKNIGTFILLVVLMLAFLVSTTICFSVLLLLYFIHLNLSLAASLSCVFMVNLGGLITFGWAARMKKNKLVVPR